jgi:hypothetical protein
MDTSIIGTKSSAKETPTAQQVKTVSSGPASGKAQSGDRKPTKKDTKPTAEEPKVPDSTTEISAPKVTEPKKPTKADLAKAIYDEMVKKPDVNRKDIITRFRKEAGLTTAGAQSYYGSSGSRVGVFGPF